MTLDILLSIKDNLSRVLAEPQKVFRRKILTDYLNGTDEEEFAAVSKILSCQIEQLWVTPTPKFNTIEYVDVLDDINLWFTRGGRSAFYNLPYISQHIIHLMSGPQTIGLSLRELADQSFTYYNPYEWLQVLDDVGTSTVCPLCGVESDILCTPCKIKLHSHTKWRASDFVLNITPENTSPYFQVNYGDFELTLGQFHVKRLDTHTIEYTLLPKCGQLVLPFEEYQTNIGISFNPQETLS